MAANWDYALKSHEMSLYGGPDGYVDHIRQDAYGDGFEQGVLLTTIVISGGALMCGAVRFAWNKISDYRERRRVEKARAEESRIYLFMKLYEQQQEDAE